MEKKLAMESNCVLIDFDDVQLEETCPTCKSNSKLLDTCKRCNGSGTVLTIIGERILKLVRKYFEVV
jgi:primosomal protein N'